MRRVCRLQCRFHCKNVTCQSGTKTFSLWSEIKEATASAQYQDGLLSLALLKPSKQKRLPIN